MINTVSLVANVETIHSYTNDQNLIDNYHKAERRGRSAPLNMVITSTGAAKAVAKVLPELSGVLTGNAIRVPTPNVSMAVMNLNLATEVTAEEMNATFRAISYHSPLQETNWLYLFNGSRFFRLGWVNACRRCRWWSNHCRRLSCCFVCVV